MRTYKSFVLILEDIKIRYYLRYEIIFISLGKSFEN